MSLLRLAAVLLPLLAASTTMRAGHSVVPDLLFVQTIHQGAYAGGRLTIENANAPVLFFMERPGRVTGQVTARRFLQLWDEGRDSFRADPPNAVLAIAAGDQMHQFVMELSDPQSAPGGISYAVKVLSGQPPERFGAGSLFIDSFPGSRFNTGPAQALAAMPSLYQGAAQAIGNAAHNATSAQQNASGTTQAATTQGVTILYGVDDLATGTGFSTLPGNRRR